MQIHQLKLEERISAPVTKKVAFQGILLKAARLNVICIQGYSKIIQFPEEIVLFWLESRIG